MVRFVPFVAVFSSLFVHCGYDVRHWCIASIGLAAGAVLAEALLRPFMQRMRDRVESLHKALTAALAEIERLKGGGNAN